MKGSHRQYHHPEKPGTVTVAGKLSLEVPPGTLKNILKQARLKKPSNYIFKVFWNKGAKSHQLHHRSNS